MAPLPEEARKLLEDPNLASFVTLMPDGSPHVTPVWVDTDGEHVIINTAEGRQKPRNLRRDPRVAVCVINRENGYNYVQIRGRVVEMTHEGAWEHINALARKYMGPDASYPRADETRVIIKVLPEHVQVWPRRRE